jgi:hypothetical protein
MLLRRHRGKIVKQFPSWEGQGPSGPRVGGGIGTNPPRRFAPPLRWRGFSVSSSNSKRADASRCEAPARLHQKWPVGKASSLAVTRTSARPSLRSCTMIRAWRLFVL